ITLSRGRHQDPSRNAPAELCQLPPNPSPAPFTHPKRVLAHPRSAAGCCARAAKRTTGPCPSRRRAIPKDHLFAQIDEGAQARGHVAASWIIEAISGIGGCPLA